MKNTNRNLALEGLRGIACMNVVIGHAAFVFFPYLGQIFRPVAGVTPVFGFEAWAVYPPFSLLFSADAAVSVFFVMSGYVLLAKFERTGDRTEIERAALRRGLRLGLPAFASVMWGWALLTSGLIMGQRALEIGAPGWVPNFMNKPCTFLEAVFNGLVSAPVFGDASLNPPIWTIQVELLGSILLFAVYSLFGRRSYTQLIVWFLIFANVLGFRSPNVLYYLSFLAGALLHPARVILERRAWISAVCFACGLAGVAYSLSPAFSFMDVIPIPNLAPYGPDFSQKKQLFWNSIGSVFLVAAAIGYHPFARVMSMRVPVYLGRISYALYLVHFSIMLSLPLWVLKLGLQSGLTRGGATMLAFSLYLVAAIVVAEIFHRLVDKPSIDLAFKLSNLTERRVIPGTRASAVAQREPAGLSSDLAPREVRPSMN